MQLSDLSRFRRSRPRAAAKIGALRGLVASLRSGAPMRAAIAEWPDGAPEAALPFLQAAARRARLGVPLGDALAPCEGLFGVDQGSLVAVVDLHLACGVDAASMLEALASEIARREVETGNARAHAAGAKLSARMIGGLPLVFIPLMPSGDVDLFDPLGLALLVTGLVLAVGGIRWLGRLLPDPPDTDDLGVLVATSLARCLEAGIDLVTAVDLAAGRLQALDEMERPPDADAYLRAARGVRLGISVRSALIRSDQEGLVSVGSCIERAQRSGAPPAKELLRLADGRRAEAQRVFEEEMRRAPVKMVVPLTLCVLPSFALLGLAPFLRGVTIAA